MKKLFIMIMCLFLFGCNIIKKTHQNTEWLGTYIQGDVSLEITSSQANEGFDFCIYYGDKFINGYALFDDSTFDHALYEAEEDGHTLNFQLKDDKIAIEETGGITYFGLDISGQYKKQ